MDLNLHTEYPIWLIVFAILLGAIYAAGLYAMEKKYAYPLTLKWVLSTFRFFSISIIAFLILNPLIKSVSYRVEKPIIIIAQDNSSSISLKNKKFYEGEYQSNLYELVQDLETDYDVKLYSFGENIEDFIKLDFDQPYTDISNAFDYFSAAFSKRNIGALILSTDGIFNKGMNPIHFTDDFPYPIHCLALGDTTPQKDLLIRKILVNDVVFEGNEFETEIQIQAFLLQGRQTVLRIKDGNQTLYEKQILIDKNDFFTKEKVIIEAKSAGLNQFFVEVEHVGNEQILINNKKDFFIDVIKSKKRILFLYEIPHPDISALKQILTQNKNTEIDLFPVSGFDGIIDPYQLIILHQLPSLNQNLSKLFSDASAKSIPLFFIIGNNTDLNLLTDHYGYAISKGLTELSENVKTAYNSQFSLFELSKQTIHIFPLLPPLLVPFNSIDIPIDADVLLKQEIRGIVTDDPILFFAKKDQQKYGMLVGDGFWRWKLYDYKINNNFTATAELINKTSQYLSLQETTQRFRLHHDNHYPETNIISIHAEVYNQSYEPEQGAEISFLLNDEEGNSTPYSFMSTEQFYQLELGRLNPGTYNYTAKANIANETFTKSGSFVVESVNLESINTVADHALLRNIAHKTHGKVFYPDQMEHLLDQIKKDDRITSVRYTINSYEPLLNMGWVIIIIILLLGVEWMLRKRFGGY